MLDSVSRQVFAPNYTVEVNKVFMNLASYLLVHVDQGHVYDLYQLAHSGDVPSWIPDFSKPLSVHGVAALRQYWKSNASGLPPSTASWAEQVGYLSIYNGVLGVTSIEIDTLDMVECFGDCSDLDITGKFWRLEGLLQGARPLESLPDAARALFPKFCLIPFPSFKENHTNRAEMKGSDLTREQFPTTPTIPGYAHVAAAGAMILADQSNFMLKHLRCNTLTPPAALYPYALNAKLMAAIFDAIRGESFIGGAYFDLPNLKYQIMRVELPEHGNDSSIPSQTPSEANPSHGNKKEAPCDCSEYCPKYSYIKDILQEAKEQRVLDWLKNTACTLADSYHEIVARHVAKQGPPSTQIRAWVEDKVKSTFSANDSYLPGLSENCTCPADKQEWHRNVLSYIIKGNKEEWDKVLPSVPSFTPEKRDGISGLYLNFKRQYTGTFITRLGFCGFTFSETLILRKRTKLSCLMAFPRP